MTRETVHASDALEAMRGMSPESFDAMLTDPPYGLRFMGKRWDYDVPSVETWREALRVLKPGAHALVACGTRTQHRMVVNLEDAGFEVRDVIAWLYGSGFPKSLDVSKAIDKRPGVGRHAEFAAELREAIAANGYTNTFDVAEQVVGRRTGAVANWQKYQWPEARWWPALRDLLGMSHEWDDVVAEAEREKVGRNERPAGWFTAQDGHDITENTTEPARRWSGYGTALKPAMELWTLVRKPLDGTVAANALKHGVGGLNIDGSRVEVTGEHGGRDGEASAGRRYTNNGSTNFAATPGPRGGAPEGRWPANVIHDGSPEVLAGFPVTETWAASPAARGQGDGGGSMFGLGGINQRDADSGSAARFFYTAKASRAEREAGLDDFTVQTADPYAEHRGRRMPEGSDRFDGHPARQGRNPHPTVKPIALTTYLARLLLPPERDTPRRILVPFAGTGSEVIGAAHAGWEHVVGIEIDAAYARIARARIEHYTGLGPLFDGL